MAKKPYYSLRLKMFELGVTQEDLTEAVGHGKTYISRRLNGKESFNTDDIKAILTVLDVPVSDCVPYFFENERRGDI